MQDISDCHSMVGSNGIVKPSQLSPQGMRHDALINQKLFWYILRQIKVLSQTQNTVDAVYINLLQNLQRLPISHHSSTLVSLISSSL